MLAGPAIVGGCLLLESIMAGIFQETPRLEKVIERYVCVDSGELRIEKQVVWLQEGRRLPQVTREILWRSPILKPEGGDPSAVR